MNFKKIFAVAMVFTGTVVGAGFASGQEIWLFFGRYGAAGFAGVLLTGIILSICGAGIILGAYRGEYTSYQSFCYVIGGRKSAKILSFLGSLFMLSCFCIMLAGSGAMFSQELNMPYIIGVIFMAAFCYIIFLFGIKGIMIISCMLTPIMLTGITILGIYSLTCDCRAAVANYSSLLTVSSSVISAIIYVSYNLLSVPPVIISMREMIPSKKGAVAAGLLGGIILCLAGLFMYFASLSNNFLSEEIPALALAHKVGENFGVFYGITIYFSMVTTALSNGYGFIRQCEEKLPHISFPVLAAFVVLFCSIASFLGFSRLVSTLYMSIGYAAILLTFLLVFYSVKSLKTLTANSHIQSRRRISSTQKSL
ncbi:MAG: hypothetical protein Q8873_04920 [Bacillota bacterium]|nr:hypothetical protein [Bacillota bacterium]